MRDRDKRAAETEDQRAARFALHDYVTIQTSRTERDVRKRSGPARGSRPAGRSIGRTRTRARTLRQHGTEKAPVDRVATSCQL